MHASCEERAVSAVRLSNTGVGRKVSGVSCDGCARTALTAQEGRPASRDSAMPHAINKYNLTFLERRAVWSMQFSHGRLIDVVALYIGSHKKDNGFAHVVDDIASQHQQEE